MSSYHTVKPPLADTPDPVVTTYIRDWKPPRVLYRTFPERLWANHFARGRIRISTLSSCRDDPHPTRGDPGEGTTRYKIPYLSSDSSADRERAEAVGIEFPFHGSRNCSIVNYTINHRISDAWVLCFTAESDSDAVRRLGRFEVQISNPMSFCLTLTHAIAQIVDIEHALIGPALYEERERVFPANRQPIAFVKPPGRYPRPEGSAHGVDSVATPPRR